MQPTRFHHTSKRFVDHKLSRRIALRGAVAASGLALNTLTSHIAAQGDDATPVRPPASSGTLSETVIQAFEDDIQEAQEMFRVPGAAAALIEGDRLVYANGFGVADLARCTQVTDRTRFRIGSNTKSITSLLVATFVDEGVLGWDDLVVDLWPEFQAPTAELTHTLRMRDLMGMGTGIAEPATIEFFMAAGDTPALELLHSMSHLDVFAAANNDYYYNNTLVSAAGYLGPLVQGTPLPRLELEYAALVSEHIFGPIGMADAAILDDPRRLGDNYAVGYTYDIFDRLSALPFVSIAGAAPAGAGLASATDMARYLLIQMNDGVTADGTRIVSAANLAETHEPGISVPPDSLNALPSILLPDTAAMHYALGWFSQTFVDGRHLLWHAGGIDGFASLMGVFPEERLGFVLLTNLEPSRGGALFNFAVQSSLLSRVFGLNRELPELLAGLVPVLDGQMAQLAAQTQRVNAGDVEPYLGQYSDGFFLRLDTAGMLWLKHSIRSMSVMALTDGGYVVTDGPGAIMGHTVTFDVDAAGIPTMSVQGFDSVRWLTGG